MGKKGFMEVGFKTRIRQAAEPGRPLKEALAVHAQARAMLRKGAIMGKNPCVAVDSVGLGQRRGRGAPDQPRQKIGVARYKGNYDHPPTAPELSPGHE